METMIRIIVIDVSNVLGAEVYDEVIVPVDRINDINMFVKKYIDLSKYRIMTV